MDECLDSKQGKTIISHVISMSNDLGLSIIAEGVENQGTADFLYDNGCSVSQGFYFPSLFRFRSLSICWMNSRQSSRGRYKEREDKVLLELLDGRPENTEGRLEKEIRVYDFLTILE